MIVMNRLLIILILGLMQNLYGQVSVKNILKSLSLEDKEFNIKKAIPKFKNSIQEIDGDFFMQKSKNRCCNFKFINISNTTTIELYIIIDSNYYDKMAKGFGLEVNCIVLFDKSLNKIFYIEYGLGGAIITKLSNLKFSISAYFDEGISKIYQLTEDLVPKSALLFNYVKNDFIYSKISFINKENIWIKNVEIIDHEFSLGSMSYSDMTKLLDRPPLGRDAVSVTVMDNVATYQFKKP